MSCSHEHVVDPPEGKRLRVCLDCVSRLIECTSCSAVTTARPDIAESGWTGGGVRISDDAKVEWTHCPDCSQERW